MGMGDNYSLALLGVFLITYSNCLRILILNDIDNQDGFFLYDTFI
jgi:hypothetical protein